MRSTEIKQLLIDATEHYGIDTQLDQTTEELAELIVEINKVRRNDPDAIFHMAQEIADCEIMIEQLKLKYRLFLVVEEEKMKKLVRLKQRIGQ